MGKIDTSRMSNATKLNKVDDAHVALEGDLGEIFGIPDNTEIDPPIFENVYEDGTIGGVTRLFQAAASSTASECIGIQFEDDTAKKRMIFVDSALQIFEWNEDDETWDLVANVEQPGSGLLSELTDIDTDAQEAGWLLAVNGTNDGYIFVEPASASGVDTFAELTDTPDAFDGDTSFDPDNDPGKFVIVNEAGTALKLTAAPTGLGDPYVIWINSPSQDPDPTSINWMSQDVDGSWSEMWLWEDVNITDGGLLTACPLTDDGNSANKFITLPIGVYDISFWYSSTGYSAYGLREWRVNDANREAGGTGTIVGPAAYGANERANVYYPPAGGIQPCPGVQFLGTRQAIQLSATPFWFEARQTAGTGIPGTVFFVSISRVK